jgi:hypothetical protein
VENFPTRARSMRQEEAKAHVVSRQRKARHEIKAVKQRHHLCATSRTASSAAVCARAWCG